MKSLVSASLLTPRELLHWLLAVKFGYQLIGDSKPGGAWTFGNQVFKE